VPRYDRAGQRASVAEPAARPLQCGTPRTSDARPTNPRSGRFLRAQSVSFLRRLTENQGPSAAVLGPEPPAPPHSASASFTPMRSAFLRTLRKCVGLSHQNPRNLGNCLAKDLHSQRFPGKRGISGARWTRMGGRLHRDTRKSGPRRSPDHCVAMIGVRLFRSPDETRRRNANGSTDSCRSGPHSRQTRVTVRVGNPNDLNRTSAERRPRVSERAGIDDYLLGRQQGSLWPVDGSPW
jgi:hypothetical protein